MRLSIPIIVLAIGGTAVAQPAQDQASASMQVYTDDDHVTVVTPSASADVTFGERLAADVVVTADVISAASVDVITAASPEAFRDERFELGAGVRYRVGETTWLRGRMLGSREDDFAGVRAALGMRVELAERNTTFEIDYTLGADRIGHVVHDDFDRRRTSSRLAMTFTQVADPQTLIDLTVDGSRVRGYQASPYRGVLIVDADSTELMMVPEVTPERRIGVAALARVRRALGNGWFAHADYRVYGDDWGLVSHTLRARAIATLRPRLTLGAHLRGYVQGPADFHQRRYLLPAPELRTADRALGRVRMLYGGAVAEVALGDPLGDPPQLLLMAGVMRFWWLDHAPQEVRDAVVVTIGVRTPIPR